MPRRSKTIRGPLGLIFAACLLASALLGAAACAGGGSSGGAQQGAQPSQTPARISAQELSKLRWIEGTWRGTGDVEEPFYERYRFENDSTLAVDGLADESVSKVTDTTRFELKDGEFGGGNEGARWVASELTADSVTFVPVRGARNTFRWQKESDDTWKAVLDWPATEGKPARRRVYKMERRPASNSK